MSRLKHKYHIDFTDFPDFQKAWENTPPENLEGWEKIAEDLSTSTYALLWSLYRTWVIQLNTPKTINWLYIEWLFLTNKLIWPYGSLDIPVATLGQAKCGWTVLNLIEENALI